jgi:multicomponent K+:H+ antiporter subunit G
MVGEGLAVHALPIALFVAVTVPVTNIFLMRAALFRAPHGRGGASQPEPHRD